MHRGEAAVGVDSQHFQLQLKSAREVGRTAGPGPSGAEAGEGLMKAVSTADGVSLPAKGAVFPSSSGVVCTPDRVRAGWTHQGRGYRGMQWPAGPGLGASVDSHPLPLAP